MLKVKISSDAKLDLIEIEYYLLNKWSAKVADDFYQKILDAVEILQSGKVVFEQYENTRFRKLLVTKHNAIIYEIDENLITVVRILQNFQDPDANYKSLSDQ